MRKASQVGQARDRALEALLTRVDIPLPDALVEHEIEHRRRALDDRLERAGLTHGVLPGGGRNDAGRHREASSPTTCGASVKASFILDKLAADEELGLEQAELSLYITQLAYQLGVAPDRLARQLTDRGQLAAVAADVLRSKAARAARRAGEGHRRVRPCRRLKAVTAEAVAAQGRCGHRGWRGDGKTWLTWKTWPTWKTLAEVEDVAEVAEEADVEVVQAERLMKLL